MENITLLQLNNNQRSEVLEKLGFKIDTEGYVLDKNKKKVMCKYSNKEVHISSAAILPGSTIVINATPITMAQYFVESEDNEP